MTDITCYDEKELEAATKRDLIAYINKTPSLLSLLYDLDLTPEETADNTSQLIKMLIIATAWKQKEADFSTALILDINRAYDKAAVAIQKLEPDSNFSGQYINGYISGKSDAAEAVQGLKGE